MNHRLLPLLAVLILAWAVQAQSRAADGVCAQCGCYAPCQKVCRVVPEDKKITVTCWGCQCEEFCVGGPSHIGALHCDEVCADCDPCHPQAACSQPKLLTWKAWIPGCATAVYTRKKLMKKTETKTVPGFKWVVDDLCPQCQRQLAEPGK